VASIISRGPIPSSTIDLISWISEKWCISTSGQPVWTGAAPQDLAASERAVQESISISPSYPAYSNLGILYLNQQRYADRHSRKPVCLAGARFGRQWLRKYQFGCVNGSVMSDYPCKLAKDRISRWVQIEDAVHQGYVDFAVTNRQLLRIRLPKLKTSQNTLSCWL
jgi:hypothetical protein